MRADDSLRSIPRSIATGSAGLADHGPGTALLHARTETEWFRTRWQRATAILFMARPDLREARWHALHHPVLRAGE